MKSLSLICISFFVFSTAQADRPKVGRKAAAEYFDKSKTKPSREVAQEAESASLGDQAAEGILFLHFGKFLSSQAYEWKESGKIEGVGKNAFGVTYLFDKWAGLDTNLRADFIEYDVSGTRATKLSLMPLWTFPRAETRFPLYFGLGAGLGVFFTQVEKESALALDYQLVAGTRFMDLQDSNTGFFVEFSLKNHLHLLSDGQLNGTALTAGAIFSF
jgi:hypothetical protein